MKNKLNPIDAAKQFINERFPHCQGALLAGSVVHWAKLIASTNETGLFNKKKANSNLFC
jgi:hypothetical protein